MSEPRKNPPTALVSVVKPEWVVISILHENLVKHLAIGDGLQMGFFMQAFEQALDMRSRAFWFHALRGCC